MSGNHILFLFFKICLPLKVLVHEAFRCRRWECCFRWFSSPPRSRLWRRKCRTSTRCRRRRSVTERRRVFSTFLMRRLTSTFLTTRSLLMSNRRQGWKGPGCETALEGKHWQKPAKVLKRQFWKDKWTFNRRNRNQKKFSNTLKEPSEEHPFSKARSCCFIVLYKFFYIIYSDCLTVIGAILQFKGSVA